jgi:hypothetical protein
MGLVSPIKGIQDPELHFSNHKYQICNKRWYGMNIIDFALLSNIVYNQDEAEERRLFEKVFDLDEWEYVPRRSSSSTSENKANVPVKFSEFRNKVSSQNFLQNLNLNLERE